MYTNSLRPGFGGGPRHHDPYVARARSVSPHGRLSSVPMMLQSPQSTVRYLAPGASPFASPGGYIPGPRAGLNTHLHARPRSDDGRRPSRLTPHLRTRALAAHALPQEAAMRARWQVREASRRHSQVISALCV